MMIRKPPIKHHLHSQRNTEMWKALEIKSSDFFVLMALSESHPNSQLMLSFTELVKVSNFLDHSSITSKTIKFSATLLCKPRGDDCIQTYISSLQHRKLPLIGLYLIHLQ
jgi:hypothetical protein